MEELQIDFLFIGTLMFYRWYLIVLPFLECLEWINVAKRDHNKGLFKLIMHILSANKKTIFGIKFWH